MEKLLFVASYGLGENLMVTPAIEYLSRRFEITLLIRDSYASLFRRYPFIREVVGLNRLDPKQSDFKLPVELEARLIASLDGTIPPTSMTV